MGVINVSSLGTEIEKAKRNLIEAVSMYPEKCKTSYGRINTGNSFEISGPGEIHYLSFKWNEGITITIDDVTTNYGEDEFPSTNLLDSWKIYPYGSSIGRRCLQHDSFTYNSPVGLSEPIRFTKNFKISIRNVGSVGYNDYHLIYYLFKNQ